MDERPCRMEEVRDSKKANGRQLKVVPDKQIQAADKPRAIGSPSREVIRILDEARKDCEKIWRHSKVPRAVPNRAVDSASTDDDMKAVISSRYWEIVEELQAGVGVKRKRLRLPEHATTELMSWFENHKNRKVPNPSFEERRALCMNTGLTDRQVKDWFTNHKKRHVHRTQERPEENQKSS